MKIAFGILGLALISLAGFRRAAAATSLPVSLNGAALPGLTQIVDGHHNIWTLASGVVKENGLAAGGKIAGVKLLLFYGGGIYQEDASGKFYDYKGAASVDPRAVSASGATIPTVSSIVDASKNVWVISGEVVYRNGVTTNTSPNVIDVYYVGGTIYIKTTNYWKWSGDGWVASTNPLSGSSAPTPTPTATNPAVPAGAESAGYTDEVFSDMFSDSKLSTIDMKNTLTQGFNWYLTTPFNHNQSTDPANVSWVSAGGLGALRLDGKGAHLWGTLLGKDSTGKSVIVGNSFGVRNGGGAYFEARLAMGYPNVYSVAAGDTDWPSFWAMSQKHLTNQVATWTGDSNSKYENFMEFDFMELMNIGQKFFNYNSSLHEWYGQYATGSCGTGYCHADTTQNLGPGVKGTFDSTEAKPVWHDFGALWIPSKATVTNGLTTYSKGSVQFYLDNKPSGTPVTWQGVPSKTSFAPASPWTFSDLDEDPQSIIFDTGSGAFMYVDWVKVWQKP